MAFWKGLVDKVTQKKEELEEEAKKRAAKKAAEMALDTGKAAAKAAVRNAERTLDYAGKKLEDVLFGEAASDDSEDSGASTKRPDDPFAKLKAEDAARKLAAKQYQAAATARAAARALRSGEVDDELAALKKKIRGE